MTDWKALLRPTVSEWLLGDLPPHGVPSCVIHSSDDAEYHEERSRSWSMHPRPIVSRAQEASR